MRARLLLGILPLLPGGLLFGACTGRPVDLGLSLRFPEGLLDQATSVTLSVFDAAGATCNEATGHVGSIPASALQFPLSDKDCTGGDLWCATIKLDRDGSTKMFAVVASKAGATLAEGCAAKAVDQDPLVVDIQAHRYSPPRCCNDGILEPGEQCDTGVLGTCGGTGGASACNAADPSSGGIADDPVCFCDCTAKEILLSVDDKTAPNLKNAPAGSKSALALAFGPGGAANPEMLRAVYEDNETGSTSGIDLHASFLGADLYPIADPVPLSQQLQFPVLCSVVQAAAGQPLDQKAPAIARASSDTVVTVYQSNQNMLGNNWDVFLNPQTPDGCTDQKPCTEASQCQTDCDSLTKTCLSAVRINTTLGGATDPRVAAGPTGTVLVTWTRKDGVYGRIWRTDGSTAPTSGEIEIATGGSAARVAGAPSGFFVVYQGPGPGDPDGIFMRPVDPLGKLGDVVAVNTVTQGVQDQPDVAMLQDGSTLVAWHSGGDVYFQRFDASGTAVSDDQRTPLNTTGVADATEQQHPAVAGANGYFVVAWETPSADDGSGDIAARFVGAASGFGYNSVSGQNDEFKATDPQTQGDRHLPAVAMSAFTAIGWEDRSTTHSGVWVRRFPPPAK